FDLQAKYPDYAWDKELFNLQTAATIINQPYQQLLLHYYLKCFTTIVICALAYTMFGLQAKYPDYAWDKQLFNLQTAATIINLQDGISTVSAVIVAYIADYYLKCFTTIVICALAYTMFTPFFFFIPSVYKPTQQHF
ncbi:hypothetical protein CFP56_002309, partial [Quercus suber]